MKKLIAIVCASVALFLSGCKTLPTPAELETASYAIGVSTAMVCNMTKISDKDRQIVIDIMNEVKYCCPTAGQTVVDAWTKTAQDYVKKLVDAKEITEAEGLLIFKTFGVVASAADYMMRVRWPKIGQYTDLVLAATNGFCDGFLAAFKPADADRFAVRAASRDYDVEAYNYLMRTRVK